MDGMSTVKNEDTNIRQNEDLAIMNWVSEC